MGGTEAGAHDQHGDLDGGLVHVFWSFLCPLFLQSHGYQPCPAGEGGTLRWQVVACGLWADSGVHGTLITPWVLAVCDLTNDVLGFLNPQLCSGSLSPLNWEVCI